MGIFGRKTEDDELEELTPEPPRTPPPPPKDARAEKTPEKPAEKSKPRYSVDEAIALMRTLPTDQHVDLVMRVVRTTLASMNVQVADIIDDAFRKQKVIEDKVASLQTAIGGFEKEISERKTEIARLEADLSETLSVKDKLERTELPAAPTPVLTAAPVRRERPVGSAVVSPPELRPSGPSSTVVVSPAASKK